LRPHCTGEQYRQGRPPAENLDRDRRPAARSICHLPIDFIERLESSGLLSMRSLIGNAILRMALQPLVIESSSASYVILRFCIATR